MILWDTTRMRPWGQKNGIEIDEVRVDRDRHAFTIYVDGNHIVTVYADTPEQADDMRASLDDGEDVRDWEDGNGNCVGTLIAERTGDGLRKTLRRIEDAGTYYNEHLGLCKDGTLWVDKANDVYYEYVTDDLDLSVDDLTDEDLKNVVVGGL